MILNPDGKAGLTLYDDTVPVTVGVKAVIAEPVVYEFGVVYERALGAAGVDALTVIEFELTEVKPVAVNCKV